MHAQALYLALSMRSGARVKIKNVLHEINYDYKSLAREFREKTDPQNFPLRKYRSSTAQNASKSGSEFF